MIEEEFGGQYAEENLLFLVSVLSSGMVLPKLAFRQTLLT